MKAAIRSTFVLDAAKRGISNHDIRRARTLPGATVIDDQAPFSFLVTASCSRRELAKKAGRAWQVFDATPSAASGVPLSAPAPIGAEPNPGELIRHRLGS